MSHVIAADRMMRETIRRYGYYAALKYCQGLGISFEDAYYMIFGREPRKI